MIPLDIKLAEKALEQVTGLRFEKKRPGKFNPLCLFAHRWRTQNGQISDPRGQLWICIRCSKCVEQPPFPPPPARGAP